MKPLIAILLLTLLPLNAWSQDCPPGALSRPKGNKIYLYFPTSADNTYPEHGSFGANTSPLAAFDVSDLDSGIGTTAQLRNRIFEIVTEDYCEFNVEVVSTTSTPSPTETRWQILGIGSDDSGVSLFGEAQDVDIGDADPQDYARVYAGTFGAEYGGTGGALNGSNSTLERWARAIGHTTSHEAGHNYGLGHGNSSPRSGTIEDGIKNHVMATGNASFGALTGEDRAGRRRHFSDTSYEIMAHNIGLNVKTLHNWDFVNPNDQDAHQLELTILSTASSLSISWWYNGSRSPWQNPSITATGATQSFQGTTYNVFLLNFSTDKSWSGGAAGVAPPGVEFHTGATFAETNPIIVYDTKVKDASGSDLPLHPRMIGFDTGSADFASGDFAMAVFNPDPDAGDLEIRDFRVQFLPRLASIESMVRGDSLFDIGRTPIDERGSCSHNPNFTLTDRRDVRLASFSDERYVDIEYSSEGCQVGLVGDAAEGLEARYCPDGNALSLFPATSIYVTATIVDPDSRHYDPEVGDFVTGPLETHVFYQIAGIVPDFNQNGIDDLLDIRNGVSEDSNGNGIVDEVEPGDDEQPQLPWWVYLIILLLLLIIIYLYRGRQKLLTQRG